MAGGSAQSEIGPVLPARIDVYQLAGQVHALARIALDCAIAGPGCDLPRALAKLDECRALLGVEK